MIFYDSIETNGIAHSYIVPSLIIANNILTINATKQVFYLSCCEAVTVRAQIRRGRRCHVMNPRRGLLMEVFLSHIMAVWPTVSEKIRKINPAVFISLLLSMDFKIE